jgi:hypothetical protein
MHDLIELIGNSILLNGYVKNNKVRILISSLTFSFLITVMDFYLFSYALSHSNNLLSSILLFLFIITLPIQIPAFILDYIVGSISYVFSTNIFVWMVFHFICITICCAFVEHVINNRLNKHYNSKKVL